MAAARPRSASRKQPLRVLIAAHGHPEISAGGGEIAAWEMFRGLQDRTDCTAWFLGCDRSSAERPGAVLTQPFSDREYLYRTRSFDWFKFANPDPGFRGEIERLFRELAPDVAHFHHYIDFGVEVFQHLRRALPKCRIVLTLHEYLAICHQHGQMVTRQHHTLCYKSSPARCQQCFPETEPFEFFLRQRYIERFFDLVDTFIAPSRFLADRYIDWGLPAERLVVLENLLPAASSAPPADIPAEGPLRVGYFGQISTLKGIDVLFDAAAALAGFSGVSFEIFGDYRNQPVDVQERFLANLAAAGRNIRFNGPYDHEQVDRLMQPVHCVVVPSIWWENSPMVIQEALRNRRPVICSDIGGMAEKVRDGIDGFHFPAGSSLALASLLRRLAENRQPLIDLATRMTGRSAVTAGLDDYLSVYRRVGVRNAELAVQ